MGREGWQGGGGRGALGGECREGELAVLGMEGVAAATVLVRHIRPRGLWVVVVLGHSLWDEDGLRHGHSV